MMRTTTTMTMTVAITIANKNNNNNYNNENTNNNNDNNNDNYNDNSCKNNNHNKIRWISSEVLAPCSILLGIWQSHGNFIKTHGWSTGAKFSGQQSWWLERAMPGAVNTKFGVLGLLPLHNLPWNSDPLAWNTWHHLESGPWCVNRQSILQWALIPCYAFLHWRCSQCVEASSQPGCRHSLGPGGHPGRTKFPSAMTHVGLNQNLWNNTYFEIFSRMNIINIHELSRIPAILLWKSWGFQWVLTPWLPWFPRVSKVWAFGDDLNDVRVVRGRWGAPEVCRWLSFNFHWETVENFPMAV